MSPLQIVKLIGMVAMQGIASQVTAQAPSPPRSFHPPVSHPIRLSGTFGELRNNHFHAGLDIKSENGSWGDPVFAIERGYISKVQVSPGGYGRALHIRHPSGITSIYAHLQSFTPDIESLVLQQQRDEKSFAIDMELPAEKFSVDRGQQIGKMGSTGYSFGPHLHFEIRNTATGINLNPQLFGFDISDNVKPIIKKISIYHFDHELIEYGQTIQPLVPSQSIDTLELDAWRVGFGIESYDLFNSGRNKNGIYSASVWVDQDLVYQFRFDSISRLDAGYYNLHIDYKAHFHNAGQIHRCFRLPLDKLSISGLLENDGIVPLFRNRSQKITLTVADIIGNEDTISFYVKRSERVSPVEHAPHQYLIHADRSDTIVTPYIEVIWPADALYQDLFCQFSSQPFPGKDIYSALYKIHHGEIPLKSPLTLKIRPYPVVDSLKNKLVMVRLTKNGNHAINCGGQWKGDWLVGNGNALGDYLIKADTQAPSIKVLRNTGTVEGRTLMFEIDDDLPGRNGLKYTTTLNNHWVLTEYDLKNKKLTCNLNRADWNAGSYHFKLLVEDTVGNTSTYDYRFNFN